MPFPEASERIEKEVLQELKGLQARSPKYVFADESQADIIEKFQVQVLALKGVYLAGPDGKGLAVLDGAEPCSVEEFASRHFRKLGYETLLLESIPFHVLFGVFMWLVIQDLDDPQVRIVSFGERHAFDRGVKGPLISTHLPTDFGTSGYGLRRAEAIDEHLASVNADPSELEWLFDYWLKPSEGLRQYLWAHRDEDIETARRLLDLLPPEAIKSILRYLAGHYWGRYLGWPDLLVHRAAEFFFAEVKSSRDKLGEKQKHWIRDNHQVLNFPYRLVKVHRIMTPA